jgi:hypothetical protein
LPASPSAAVTRGSASSIGRLSENAIKDGAAQDARAHFCLAMILSLIFS